uniref:Hexosyltransferase n=1 Tax=Steinernema glaseri TaxID=37863 RepID=A0A1I7Y8I6_9BILA
MRIASPKFIITVGAILALRKSTLLEGSLRLVLTAVVLFVLQWYGDKVGQYTSYRPELINATFANFYLEYEILTYLNPIRCSGKKLFVFVISAVHYSDQRDMIRSTWSKKEHVSLKVTALPKGLYIVPAQFEPA